MTVVFRFDYKTDGGDHYRKGEVAQLPDPEAERLIGSGIVERRREPGPTETKGEEPEEPPEDEPA